MSRKNTDSDKTTGKVIYWKLCLPCEVPAKLSPWSDGFSPEKKKSENIGIKHHKIWTNELSNNSWNMLLEGNYDCSKRKRTVVWSPSKAQVKKICTFLGNRCTHCTRPRLITRYIQVISWCYFDRKEIIIIYLQSFHILSVNNTAFFSRDFTHTVNA